jgi:hypothetical protein
MKEGLSSPIMPVKGGLKIRVTPNGGRNEKNDVSFCGLS